MNRTSSSNVNQPLQICSMTRNIGSGSVQSEAVILSLMGERSQFNLIPGCVFKQKENTEAQMKKTDIPATICKDIRNECRFQEELRSKHAKTGSDNLLLVVSGAKTKVPNKSTEKVT